MYLLVYVAPAFIVAAWIYYEFKASAFVKNLVEQDVPTDHHFRAWRETLAEEGARCWNAAASLRHSGVEQGLPVRGDGQFDGRSRNGSRLNREIGEFESAAEEVEQTLDELSSVLAARLAARIGPGAWIIAAGFSTMFVNGNIRMYFLIGSVSAIIAAFSFYFFAKHRLRNLVI